MNFQAFVFCGKGLKLAPFSNTRGDKGMPKPLLPVANRAMLEYVLDWCDQAQFKEINIVVDEGDEEVMQEGLAGFMQFREECYDVLSKNVGGFHTHYLRKPAPIQFIGAKSEFTGEILQQELLERITGDFVLLPCDFITNIPPQIFLDQYLNRDHDSLAMAVYYQNAFENIDKKQIKKFFTVYTDNEDSMKQPVLLDIYSREDVEKTKYLKMRSQMLWRYPNSTVSVKLLNSYIYFCSHELVHLLSTDDSAVAADSDGSDSEDEVGSRNPNQIRPSYFRNKTKMVKDPMNGRKSFAKLFRDIARRSWQHSRPRETVSIFIMPDVGIFIRANNLSAYMEANRYILKIKSASTSHTVPVTGSSSAIGADSVIGASCTILGKTNVKRSVVGANCKIGNRCRIVGSILLDGAEIDDEVTLENVIVGKFGKVGKKTKLTNCYVEGYYSVAPRTVLKGETLANIYIEGENEFDDSDMDTSSSEESTDQSEMYNEEEYEGDDLFER
ncbi:AAL114Cp [Eremothecium gossypii ATCC 10895]|uniref:Translation initiation factor eIF2B subunit gamma n=1 Tax=Eremothecium gossypii (strain ATCC 10895 / CBS 109.51 / FGSC 9923 / NRRL Y-1056) TaxID=284811 RepID=Q75F42_EREGS|nr:AAL114Cp [Eremothecium gossypii ATCC 10895]AAS50252.1 AAL114Cp [Eremothecium gossypii ATCC 10895]AEY94537.1 FAAL114Cp [Eremothecium gossypii FDAG1]